MPSERMVAQSVRAMNEWSDDLIDDRSSPESFKIHLNKDETIFNKTFESKIESILLNGNSNK